MDVLLNTFHMITLRVEFFIISGTQRGPGSKEGAGGKKGKTVIKT